MDYANGASTLVDFDQQHRPVRYRVTGPASAGGTQTLWDSGTYVYDGAGNLEAVGGQTFAYDRVGRVSKARVRMQARPGVEGEAHTEVYQCDAYGQHDLQGLVGG